MTNRDAGAPSNTFDQVRRRFSFTLAIELNARLFTRMLEYWAEQRGLPRLVPQPAEPQRQTMRPPSWTQPEVDETPTPQSERPVWHDREPGLP